MMTTMWNRSWLLSLFVLGIGLLIGCNKMNGLQVSPVNHVKGYIAPQHELKLNGQESLRLSLLDVSGADARAEVMASTVISGHRQWPVPYRLEYAGDQSRAGHRYVVQLRLESADGRLLAITDVSHPLDFNNDQAADLDVMLSATGPESGRSLDSVSYDCDGLSFAVQFGAGYAIMKQTGRGGQFVLTQLPSASGARYDSERAEIWTKATEAMISIGDARYRACRWRRPELAR